MKVAFVRDMARSKQTGPPPNPPALLAPLVVFCPYYFPTEASVMVLEH